MLLPSQDERWTEDVMSLLARIFGWGAKERERRRSRLDDHLSVAEPKAAVGAQQSVDGPTSETEQALRRSTRSENSEQER